MSQQMGQLLTQHIPRLRRYARALTGDVQRADDLVQDCLERAWSRLHLWRKGEDMRPWLFTILHNLFANSARKYAREPAWVPLPEEEALSAVDHYSPQETALSIYDLQLALSKLSNEHREVLLLVSLEQLGYQEVATILNIPLGTVMSRLARARERLRELLHESPQPRLRRVR